MANDKWSQVKDILDAAIQRKPDERSAFLDDACDGDADVRNEVESLLSSFGRADGFMGGPLFGGDLDAPTAITESATFSEGQTLGPYEIIRQIGAGGMGEVFLARDSLLDRQVAIKVLPRASIGDEQAKKRLFREARAAAKLDHPNICSIYEISEDDGTAFIAMQYIDGETLASVMRQGGLALAKTLDLAAQIANALSEAHSQDIVHRDIKPANMIVNQKGQVKVLDFGLAKFAADQLTIEKEAETQIELSQPGMILGTLSYMSPEQVKGEKVDARSDIFSFGVLLYEMISGRGPFDGDSAAETISLILTAEPEPLRNSIPGMRPALETLITKCLAKDREDRYQTMNSLLIDLVDIRRKVESGREPLTLEEPTVRLESAVASRRFWPSKLPNTRWMIVAASVVLTIAAVYAWTIWRTNSKQPDGGDSGASSQAYDLYMRGKVKVSSEDREDNDAAIKLLEQSVAIDPDFALAYAVLARAYNINAFYFAASDAERKEMVENAEVAVEKALALNPDLPEGHLARGLILWSHGNRYPHEQAIQSYKRAIALNPNLDEAHHQLGLIYLHIGLLDKGTEEIEKAMAINPSNTMARFRLGVGDLYETKYEDALSVFNGTPLEKNPSLWAFQTATALFQLGRSDEAMAMIEEYLNKYPKDEGGVGNSVKGMILAKAGKQSEAEESIQRAIEIGQGFGHFHHTAYNVASAYSLLNEREQALKWLQIAADDGFPCYPLFMNDTNLDILRKDERFIAFMAKLKQQWERYKAEL